MSPPRWRSSGLDADSGAAEKTSTPPNGANAPVNRGADFGTSAFSRRSAPTTFTSTANRRRHGSQRRSERLLGRRAATSSSAPVFRCLLARDRSFGLRYCDTTGTGDFTASSTTSSATAAHHLQCDVSRHLHAHVLSGGRKLSLGETGVLLNLLSSRKALNVAARLSSGRRVRFKHREPLALPTFPDVPAGDWLVSKRWPLRESRAVCGGLFCPMSVTRRQMASSSLDPGSGYSN